MKNNKLIAKFMELSIKEGVCYYTDKYDMFPMNIEVETPYLPYDEDWNWLMDSVNKCLSTPTKEEGGYFKLKQALTTADMNLIHNEVLAFIKKQ